MKDLHTHVAARACDGATRRAKPRVGERASRNASEPDSASLRLMGAASLPEKVKPAPATKLRDEQSPGSSGWLGAARADRFDEELERPGGAGMAAATERGKP